jgi:hypothetical protein
MVLSLRVSCNIFTPDNSGSCDIKLIYMCKGFNCLSVSLPLDIEIQSVTLLSYRLPRWQRALYDSRTDRTGNTRHNDLSNWMQTKLMSLFSLCSSFPNVLFFCYRMEEGYLGRYLEEILGMSYNSIWIYTAGLCLLKCVSIAELLW